jgi:membrane protease YdiL (CAAX protease family)
MSTAYPEGLPAPFVHPAPPRSPELPDGIEPTSLAPDWRAWMGFAALLVGFVAAAVGAVILTLIGGAFDGSVLASGKLANPSPAVNILATVVQGFCLIGAAVFFARIAGRPRPWDFGLRGTRFWPAVGWALVTWGAFLLVTLAWVNLVGADDASEKLPSELGADKSSLALVCVGILVCVIAPLAEEFFFRGFFFTALRSWKGIWPAALVTGLIFGGIHAGSSNVAFLVPLAFFGFSLCLLYAKTGSLYPCIGIHAANNSIAFCSSQDWGWQMAPVLAAALALVALVCWLVRRIAGPTPAWALS